MHEVAEFLRAHAPFDLAAAEELEEIAAAVEIEFLPAGSALAADPVAPEPVVHVVRRGALAVRDGERLLDVLGEGEIVPWPGAAALDVRADEDAITYRLPAAALEPLLARPEGLRWAARAGRAGAAGRGVGQFALHRGANWPDPLDPGGRPVRELARPAPLLQPGDAVGDAARAMAASGASCVLVQLGSGLGILTDRDLRERVLAAGRGPDVLVGEAMTAPARAVAGERAAGEVLIELLELGVRHAPVVDAAGALLGVVSELELLAGGPLAPFVARRRIERAPDRPGLLAAAAAIPQAALALAAAGAGAERVEETLSALADATARRLVALAEADLGPPPAAYGWYATGPHGRREARLSGPAVGLLAWEGRDDDPGLRSWFLALAARVAADLHGADGAQPPARSAHAWASALRDGTVPAAVLADARCLGPDDPAGGEIAAALRDVAGAPAAGRRPPTGFYGGLVVDAAGDLADRLDLERDGLEPIADLARALALRAGVGATGTGARIAAARDGGGLAPPDAALLEAARGLLLELRLAHQADQVRAGEAPDARVDPASLAPLTRALLRQAFRGVERLQREGAARLA